MSRLIDANAVVKAILEERDKIPRTITTAPYELGTEKPFHAGDQMRGGIRKALRCIEQVPTVDAVVVTRCKNCNHSTLPSELTQRYGKPGTLTCHNRRAPCNRRNVGSNDFCSYGEPKEGTC